VTLREKRIEFSRCIALLVTWANEQGMHICFDKDGMKHMDGSNHYIGLAKDFILYSDEGEYLTHCDHYRPLGEKWKILNSLARWGGDFQGKNEGDGGHMSFEHNGVE
jgi:hypothetical protein